MTLDLDEGDPERAEATPAERRRAARAAVDEGKSESKARGSSGSRRSTSASARDKIEQELTARLDRTFTSLAKTMEARGDDELAAVIREEAEVMGQGVISLTRNVKVLRGPLLFLLNLIEPVMAFGRIGRLLYSRFRERQWRIQQERAEQAEQAGEQVTDAVVVS